MASKNVSHICAALFENSAQRVLRHRSHELPALLGAAIDANRDYQIDTYARQIIGQFRL
jgi:hypothetical protein